MQDTLLWLPLIPSSPTESLESRLSALSASVVYETMNPRPTSPQTSSEGSN